MDPRTARRLAAAKPFIEEAATLADTLPYPDDVDKLTAEAAYRRGATDAGDRIRNHAYRGTSTTARTGQLVVLGAGEPEPQFTIEELTKRDKPTDFEDVDLGYIIPRLGTLDMLRLSGFAIGRGWSVARINFADGAMKPLTAKANDLVADDTRTRLGHDGPAGALYWLADNHPAKNIITVQLRDPDGNPVTITRLGTITAQNLEPARSLIEAAWKPLALA